MREHNDAVSRIDFIDLAAEVKVEPGAGQVIELPQHDGSVMRLRKLHADYDPTDRVSAMNHVQALQARGEVVTGLLYLDPQATDLHVALKTCRMPLNKLEAPELCPGTAALAAINASLR